MMTLMIDPAQLEELPGNENVLDEETYVGLVRFIKEKGFKQPLLVRQLNGGKYGVVDGIHRKRAAIEVGLTMVPCEVDETIKSDADARAIRIGMNKNRGVLDLGAVSRSFATLSNAGWSAEDISVVGYSLDEVRALLEAASAPDPDTIVDGAVLPQADGEDGARRTWKIELEFTDEKEYLRARNALKRVAKSAGCAGDLSAGLVTLVNAWEED
jgi:ParB-like nuclease domain